MNNGKQKTESTIATKEISEAKSASEQESVYESNRNDKRYEKPFEDEGACDDDFID